MQTKHSVALIASSASGIGEATANHLSALGLRVAIVDRDPTQIDRVVSEIQAAGGQFVGICADVTSQ